MSVYFYSFLKYIYFYLYGNTCLPPLDRKIVGDGRSVLIVAGLTVFSLLFKDLNIQSCFRLFLYGCLGFHSVFELSDFSYPFFILSF